LSKDGDGVNIIESNRCLGSDLHVIGPASVLISQILMDEYVTSSQLAFSIKLLRHNF